MAELTTNLNYLQPTGYKLVIDRKNFPNLEYFAQSVSHPGVTANASEIPFRSLAQTPFVGASLTYGEISANIILDEDMQSYTEMHDWIRRVVDEKPRRALDRDTNSPPTYCDITLSILSSQNEVLKKVRYLECCPTTLGEIQFESTASGTEFLTFPVSFRFTYFELV